MNFKNIGEHPKTIDEAVSRLLIILTGDKKAEIKTMAKDDLVFLLYPVSLYPLPKNLQISYADNSLMRIVQYSKFNRVYVA